jgi:moderate conductance mechanosensitive channel
MPLETSENVVQEVLKPEAWRRWGEQVGRAVLTLAIAWILTRLVKWSMGRLRHYAIRIMDRRREGVTVEMEKRANTVASALGKAVSTVIWIVAVVIALRELNVHIEPLLAGLGIAGIAVGLGAQTLIKDWLGGLFLLLEDQVRIGDSVVINSIAGVVEEINLRTTMLRGENGAVHVITNGSITTLSNLTREYSYYIFEATLAHGEDADRALAIIAGAGNDLYADEQFQPIMLSPMELMGIDRLADRGVVVKARVKTLPSKQALVGRELNRLVSIKLKAAGISFPQLLSPQA